MRRRRKILLAATAASAITLAGVGWAAEWSDDDGTETPITGTALDRASSAALEHTGEGHVTGTEVGDEESHYEVEVTLDDGTQVDVQLDADFQVVGTEADSDSEEDEG